MILWPQMIAGAWASGEGSGAMINGSISLIASSPMSHFAAALAPDRSCGGWLPNGKACRPGAPPKCRWRLAFQAKDGLPSQVRSPSPGALSFSVLLLLLTSSAYCRSTRKAVSKQEGTKHDRQSRMRNLHRHERRRRLDHH